MTRTPKSLRLQIAAGRFAEPEKQELAITRKRAIALMAVGTTSIARLRDGNRVLIAEACPHLPLADDIGRAPEIRSDNTKTLLPQNPVGFGMWNRLPACFAARQAGRPHHFRQIQPNFAVIAKNTTGSAI